MRSNETLPLILLSLVFASHGCAFGRRRMHTHRKSDGEGDKCTCATLTRYNSLAEFNRTVDVHCECGSVGFGVIRKMSYNVLEGDLRDALHVDLTSTCVKCSMCAAIAGEVSMW